MIKLGAGVEVESDVGIEAGVGPGVSGMSGGTSSCASRRAEDSVAAVCTSRAAPSLCVADGGADSYFLRHSAVV